MMVTLLDDDDGLAYSFRVNNLDHGDDDGDDDGGGHVTNGECNSALMGGPSFTPGGTLGKEGWR